MVLHVAGGELVRVLAFEFGEEVRGDLAERIHEHGEATAVRHADDHFLGALGADVLDDRVEHRDHALAALAGEALLADVAGVQVALERLGGRDALEDPAPMLGCEARRGQRALEIPLDPALLFSRRDVHVFDADRAAISLLHRRHDVAKLHGTFGPLPRTRRELAVHVGLGEAVEIELELRHRGALEALQRIELRVARAHHAVRADELQHLQRLFVGRRGRRRARRLRAAREALEGRDHRRVRDVLLRRVVLLPRVEERAPGSVDRVGVGEITLVELFHKGRVGAKQLRSCLEFLHHACHVYFLLPIGTTSLCVGPR